MAQKYTLNGQAARNVQAYIDYVNVVGHQEGPLMSEKEYEAYKERLQKNIHKRVFGVWRNINGKDCKVIGPATKCFCNHRLSEHNYQEPSNSSSVKCKNSKCDCIHFYYIPTHGSYDFKCLCKHSFKDHDNQTKKCNNSRCKGCSGFNSTWSCSCGLKFGDHMTVFETYQDRLDQGKPVNECMQMLGNFMQLASNQERLDMQVSTLDQKLNQIETHQNMTIQDSQQKQNIKINNLDRLNQQQQNLQSSYLTNALDLFNTPHLHFKVNVQQKRLLQKF